MRSKEDTTSLVVIIMISLALIVMISLEQPSFWIVIIISFGIVWLGWRGSIVIEGLSILRNLKNLQILGEFFPDKYQELLAHPAYNLKESKLHKATQIELIQKLNSEDPILKMIAANFMLNLEVLYKYMMRKKDFLSPYILHRIDNEELYLEFLLKSPNFREYCITKLKSELNLSILPLMIDDQKAHKTCIDRIQQESYLALLGIEIQDEMIQQSIIEKLSNERLLSGMYDHYYFNRKYDLADKIKDKVEELSKVSIGNELRDTIVQRLEYINSSSMNDLIMYSIENRLVKASNLLRFIYDENTFRNLNLLPLNRSVKREIESILNDKPGIDEIIQNLYGIVIETNEDINFDQVLYQAENAPGWRERKEAILKIKDDRILHYLYQREDHNKVKQTIIENINSQSIKNQLLKKNKNKSCPECGSTYNGYKCGECQYTVPFCIICYQLIESQDYITMSCCSKTMHVRHYNKLHHRCPYCKTKLK
ncbi:MAG: hypothetical protein INQ03_18485 [Candidatus Heimdallarchaeota archaeon]|nr:hypothetical protein [Candidatus Heimdallarchaeota archaeon]